MPPRWRDRRQAAGTHVSLALGPSASSFSLSIKARLRDSLCIERVQRYEAQLSWGASLEDSTGPLAPTKKEAAPGYWETFLILPALGCQGDKTVQKWTQTGKLLI